MQRLTPRINKSGAPGWAMVSENKDRGNPSSTPIVFCRGAFCWSLNKSVASNARFPRTWSVTLQALSSHFFLTQQRLTDREFSPAAAATEERRRPGRPRAPRAFEACVGRRAARHKRLGWKRVGGGGAWRMFVRAKLKGSKLLPTSGRLVFRRLSRQYRDLDEAQREKFEALGATATAAWRLSAGPRSSRCRTTVSGGGEAPSKKLLEEREAARLREALEVWRQVERHRPPSEVVEIANAVGAAVAHEPSGGWFDSDVALALPSTSLAKGVLGSDFCGNGGSLRSSLRESWEKRHAVNRHAECQPVGRIRNDRLPLRRVAGLCLHGPRGQVLARFEAAFVAAVRSNFPPKSPQRRFFDAGMAIFKAGPGIPVGLSFVQKFRSGSRAGHASPTR